MVATGYFDSSPSFQIGIGWLTVDLLTKHYQHYYCSDIKIYVSAHEPGSVYMSFWDFTDNMLLAY